MAMPSAPQRARALCRSGGCGSGIGIASGPTVLSFPPDTRHGPGDAASPALAANVGRASSRRVAAVKAALRRCRKPYTLPIRAPGNRFMRIQTPSGWALAMGFHKWLGFALGGGIAWQWTLL